MPFVLGGGLFVRNQLDYPLGSMVNLSIQLTASDSPIQVHGKVIWITPKGAQGGKPSGIGVQFIEQEESRLLVHRIESILAGTINSARNTDTF